MFITLLILLFVHPKDKKRKITDFLLKKIFEFKGLPYKSANPLNRTNIFFPLHVETVSLRQSKRFRSDKNELREWRDESKVTYFIPSISRNR